MPGSTTIKVPKALRDRLASRAKEHGSTLAETIERALDDSDESTFWRKVRVDNARLSSADRTAYLRAPTLHDDLVDKVDDSVAPEEW